MMNKRGQQLDIPGTLFTFVTGFVILSVIAWVMAEFGYPRIEVTPWLTAFIMVLAAWGAWAIVFQLNYITGKQDIRRMIFVVILAAVGLYLLYTYIPGVLEGLMIGGNP